MYVINRLVSIRASNDKPYRQSVPYVQRAPAGTAGPTYPMPCDEAALIVSGRAPQATRDRPCGHVELHGLPGSGPAAGPRKTPAQAA